MALVSCPECGNKVSTFAQHCMSCGCPTSEFERISEEQAKEREAKKAKEAEEREAKKAKEAEICYGEVMSLSEIAEAFKKCEESDEEDDDEGYGEVMSFFNNDK